MRIDTLQIRNLRCIISTDINFLGKRTLLTGVNGSGKTSFLEALHILCVGRSFRSSKSGDVIRHGNSSLTVHAKQQLPQISLGIEKSKSNTVTSLNGIQLEGMRELARLNPTLIYFHESIQLVAGLAQFRRKYLDWGLFHVKHSYLESWSGYMRTLRQRNALLRAIKYGRREYSPKELEQWNILLNKHGQQLHLLRKEMSDTVSSGIDQVAHELQLPKQNITYYPGYDGTQDYAHSIDDNIEKDLAAGTTTNGPHRSDIVFEQVKDTYSRGQQKLLALAMLIAMARWFNSFTPHQSLLILIDDIASELDSANQELIIKALQNLDAQIVVTNIARQKNLYSQANYDMVQIDKGSIVG